MKTILLVLLSIFMISCGSDSGSDTGSGSTTNLAKTGTYPYEWGKILYGYEIQFTVKEASEHSVDVGFQVIYAFNNTGSVVGHNTNTGVNYSPESYDYIKNTDNNITIHLSYNSGNSNEYYTLIPTSATTGSYTYEANNYGNTAWARGTYVILVDGGGYDGGTPPEPLPNGSWKTAISVDNDINSTLSPRGLAIDENNNTFTVWQSSSIADVFATIYSTTSGWEKLSKLNAESTQAVRPQIIINPDGNGFALWNEADKATTYDINYSVKSRPYNTFSGWGVTQTLTSPLEDMLMVDAAMDKNGNAIILMSKSTNDNNRPHEIKLFIKKYSPGSGWENATTEIGTGYQVNFNSKIVMSDNGDIMIGWGADTPGLAHYTKSADTWEFLGRYTFSTHFDIAGNDTGNFIIIWNGRTATIPNPSMLAMKYIVGSGLDSSPTVLEADTQVEYPKIAINSNGDAIAVWQSVYWYLIWPSSYAMHSIKSSYYSDGVGWSPVVFIDTDSIESKGNPSIAFDEQNNAVAIWNGSQHIYANHYISGTGWSGERRIASNTITETRSDFSKPQLVLHKNGVATVIWSQYIQLDDGTWSSDTYYSNSFY